MKNAFLLASATILAATAMAAEAQAQAPGATKDGMQSHETVTPLFKGAMPNVPGKVVLAAEVLFPPGDASPPHMHPKSAFIYAYVLSGEVISAVDDETPRVYKSGESWHEAPGAHHRVAGNASKTTPARLLVVFVMDPSETQLVLPDSK